MKELIIIVVYSLIRNIWGVICSKPMGRKLSISLESSAEHKILYNCFVGIKSKDTELKSEHKICF